MENLANLNVDCCIFLSIYNFFAENLLYFLKHFHLNCFQKSLTSRISVLNKNTT